MKDLIDQYLEVIARNLRGPAMDSHHFTRSRVWSASRRSFHHEELIVLARDSFNCGKLSTSWYLGSCQRHDVDARNPWVVGLGQANAVVAQTWGRGLWYSESASDFAASLISGIFLLRALRLPFLGNS
jgi:hypothetical protein